MKTYHVYNAQGSRVMRLGADDLAQARERALELIDRPGRRDLFLTAGKLVYFVSTNSDLTSAIRFGREAGEDHGKYETLRRISRELGSAAEIGLAAQTWLAALICKIGG